MPKYYIDISSNNGAHIDFAAVKRDGIDGVWIKATEGLHYNNPYAERHAREARAAGLRVGFYHYANAHRGNQASDEALHFVSQVRALGGIKRRDLRPVLDLETNQQNMAWLPAWSRAWNKIVRDNLKIGPLFYSYGDFIRRMNPSNPIGHGLWLANYGTNDGRIHPASPPEPWKNISVHQFTSVARVNGVPGGVDKSIAHQFRAILAHPITGRI